MNNVYIGNRYVPIFANPVEWDNLREFEPLTIVTYQGTAYTSKKTVPVGTPLSNNEYWVVTGNYNAQVEQYRQDVESYRQDTVQLENEVNALDKVNYLGGKKILIIGDSISDEDLYPRNWVSKFRVMVNDNTTITNLSLSGKTLAKIGGETNNLPTTLSSVSGEYDIIVLYLGVNDWMRQVPLGTFISGDNTTICGSLKYFNEWKTQNYPNAKVVCITPLKSKKADFTGHKLLQLYASCICSNALFFGWGIIDAHSFAPLMNPNANNIFTIDGIHPNEAYSQIFADYIYNNMSKEENCVGTNFSSYVAIGDAGGASNRIFCEISGDGLMSYDITNYSVSGTGSIKLADIPEECKPRNNKTGVGVVVLENGSTISVFLAFVGDALYVSLPPNTTGTLYATFGNLYANFMCNLINGSF